MRVSEAACESTLREIAEVHAALGYPREVVALWALPEPDARDLWKIARESEARRVLEVGSFVGTSALLMAHALPGAQIHSVDPNLPLDIEFTAMGASGKSADLSRRTLEIARLATERMGFSDRLHFHEGGFAVGENFALADAPVPVIGPALCAKEGPFDLAFVDGLHFEEAVVADVTLALTALAPRGVVVLHDAIGYWGSHVRRAVHRVLERDATLVFEHQSYQGLYRAIATLSRVPGGTVAASTKLADAFGDAKPFVEQLARLVRLHFPSSSPRGCDELSAEVTARLGRAGDGSSPRLAIALDTLDHAAPHERRDALDRVLGDCDAALVGSTPPGEKDAAAPWSRPLAARVVEFGERGFDAFDVVQPSFEPLSHAFGDRCAIPRRTSFLLDAVVVARRGTEAWRSLAATHAPLTPAHARALTDLRLQLLFATCAQARLRSELSSYTASPDREAEIRRLSDLVHQWSSWRVHVGRFHFWRR